MKAKFVNESLNEGKTYKKGDKVRYKTYFAASPMVANSTVEEGPEEIGRIQKAVKHWAGQRYIINGLTVPESYIIGLVDENMQTPFKNDGNKAISQKYPLENPNYLGDSVGPPNIEEENIRCEACDRLTHPKDFEAGVCKRCAAQGIWQDRFGKLHRQSSRMREPVNVAFESSSLQDQLDKESEWLRKYYKYIERGTFPEKEFNDQEEFDEDVRRTENNVDRLKKLIKNKK